MEWIFDKGVIDSLFAALQQNMDSLDSAEPDSPVVCATLKSIQVFNLAWKLQPTYFDIVRPIVMSSSSKAQPVGSSNLTSLDDVFLTHLDAIVDLAQFTASKHVAISLEAIALLRRVSASRKLSEGTDNGLAQSRNGNRLISLLSPISTVLTLELRPDFELDDWDLETPDVPPKLLKAKAILDLLQAGLDASGGKPNIAHCLLGFSCYGRVVDVAPQSAFAASQALFHAIVSCAADLPIAVGDGGYRSWLLDVKRGCLEVILKLAVSPLTGRIIKPQLRAMDFLPALAKSQVPVTPSLFWDGKATLDPSVLLESSALAISHFMHVRQAFFQFAAADLKGASEQNAFSVQEKIVGALLGTINLPTGEQIATPSIFELFDFFELETAPALEPNYSQCTYFTDVDLSSCTRGDVDTVIAFDVGLAYELLTLRKKELRDTGIIKEPADSDKARDEMQAILASLTSQNNWRLIQSVRTTALEAWADLLSLVVTKGGLAPGAVVTLSLQGLVLILPKLEKSLTENMEAAGIMAKLTLTFTHAISAASSHTSQQTANVAIERLLTIFRVSLKALADSSTDLALRDVSYRTSCAVLASFRASATNENPLSTANSKQLLQLVQNAGDRLLTVVTEDAFSGRGITRVSALLFLDGLVSLFQDLKMMTPLLRALMKLNFIPVLVDMSVGSVAAAFRSEDEMASTLAYYHTALALLLRLCQTPDGTQVVLNAGFLSAIEDSKLFSTDPDIGLDVDNPTALKEFYSILSDLIRVITAAVISKGAQPGRTFLHQHRHTVQAIFKQSARGHAIEVADELSRLILATDFLEVCYPCLGERGRTNTPQEDEPVLGGAMRNGFS
jgi:nuclear pore complex protein Nup205